MIRLMLVDDHQAVRAGYQRLLEQDGTMQVIAQTAKVDEACALYERCAPDVTVTDLSMPGSGGLELIRRLCALDARARVLVFSMHVTEFLVHRAFDIGAAGFVSKSSSPQDLLDGVRGVMAGRRSVSPDLAFALALPRFDSSGLAALTRREFEVFSLLARGETASDCARALHLSPKTVSNVQTTLREKLGLSTSAAMTLLALRHGLVSA